LIKKLLGGRNLANMVKRNDYGQSGLRKEDGTNLASSQSHQQPTKAKEFALKTEEAQSCEIWGQTHYIDQVFNLQLHCGLNSNYCPGRRDFKLTVERRVHRDRQHVKD
jgi:hypothetical protein